MIHDIQIKRKYILGGKIKWYTDQNNIRYTRDDILYIINNGKVPDRLSIIYGFKLTGNKILPNAKINMIVTKGGVLRSTKGIVEVQSVHNRHKICVINEDSNSGYILCYNLLTRMFPEVDFDFVNANGNKTIKGLVYNLLNKYNKFILIVDNKEADSVFLTDLVSLSSTMLNLNIKYAILKPLSIEEMLLSWKDLPIKRTSNMKKELELYFETGKIPYKYMANDNYIFCNKGIHNLEQEIFKELCSILNYRYSKSAIEYCVYTNCCNMSLNNNIKFENVCRRVSNIDKLKSIAENSLFGALHNIVSNIEYGKEHYLLHWSNTSRDKLYRLKGVR